MAAGKGGVMRVIVAGSRSWTDYTAICDAMREHFPNATEVVCGMAKGADALGARYATEHGIAIAKFPADWNLWGRAAGPIRNGEMAQYADALLAFWDGKSVGTAHMIRLMEQRKKRVVVISPTPEGGAAAER